MLGWPNVPEARSQETYPLRETKDRKQDGSRSGGVPEDEASQSGLPSPAGFVSPQEPADSPYAQQPAYNPYYSADENIATAGIKLVDDQGGSVAEEEDAKESDASTNDPIATCIAYCVIVIMLAAFVTVAACIIYFGAKNPTVTKLLLDVADGLTHEAGSSQRGNEKAAIEKLLNPAIARAVTKYVNESRRDE